MKQWERYARGQILLAALNPDFAPEYRVPARRWWQFWKPKWETVQTPSINQLRRAHGVPALSPKDPQPPVELRRFRTDQKWYVL